MLKYACILKKKILKYEKRWKKWSFKKLYIKAKKTKIVDYKWQITIKFEKLKNEGIERS